MPVLGVEPLESFWYNIQKMRKLGKVIVSSGECRKHFLLGNGITFSLSWQGLLLSGFSKRWSRSPSYWFVSVSHVSLWAARGAKFSSFCRDAPFLRMQRHNVQVLQRLNLYVIVLQLAVSFFFSAVFMAVFIKISFKLCLFKNLLKITVSSSSIHN